MEGDVKGHIAGNKTYITKPKLKEKHAEFFRDYLSRPDLRIDITRGTAIIHDKFGIVQLEMLVRAYIYEFGKWE